MGFALTNLSSLDIPIEFLALTVDGQPAEGAAVTNPASFTIGAKGQFAAVLPEIFGSGIQDAEPVTVIIHSRIVEPVILFLVGDNENTLLDGTIFDQQALKAFALPILGREGLGPFTKVYAFNPSTETPSELALTLHDSAGVQVAAREFELGPQEAVSGELSELLEVDIASFSGGYIRGQADEAVLAFESFGSEDALSNLNAQSLGIVEDIYRIPHFAVGAGFDTEVNLVNLDAVEIASLRVSAYDDDGEPLPIPSATQFSVEPGGQLIISLASLFGVVGESSELIVGSLRIDVEPRVVGIVLKVPIMGGSIRFRSLDGRTSASLPLFLSGRRNALYPHIAQALGFFTGVAVLNPLLKTVEATVEVFSEEGFLVGTALLSLPPNGRVSRLLVELVPASSGQLGGYFRVLSDDRVVSFALFGDLKGESIFPTR